MRVIVNESLIQKRAAAARRAVNLGFPLLFVALALSFNRRYVGYAYLLLIPGIILLNWGVSRANKWMRRPRLDQALAKALKGFDHGLRFYNYVLPADHVLLSPAGLFVLKVKDQDGPISCRGEKWRRGMNLGRFIRTLFEERLGNPSQQAQTEADKLRRFIGEHLPGTDVPVRPVIVFTHPQVKLEVVEPAIPAMTAWGLKTYLRDAIKERNVPQETLQALTNLFDEQPT